MKFLIVDDHALFSEGLQFVIEGSVEGASCTLASSAEDADLKMKNDDFDMILVDLNMPGVDGLSLIRAEMTKGSTVPMVVLSSVEDKHRIASAMEAGARGYISKTSNSVDVVAAVQQVLAGKIFYEDEMLTRSTWIDAGAEHSQRLKLYGLSERQHEVLTLLKSGLSNKQIARFLDISPETVKFHVGVLLRSLKANNRVDCIEKAKKLHLIE